MDQHIRKIRDAQGISYILLTPGLFLQTGYKVMRSQRRGNFIPCTRISHNGKDKLVYNTGQYKDLVSLLTGLKPEVFLTIINHLITLIEDIKGNGFLQCINVDVSFKNIFIDPTDFSVHLIYVPVNFEDSSETVAALEAEIKKDLARAIQSYENLKNPNTIALVAMLQNPIDSLKSISEFIQNRSRFPSSQLEQTKEPSGHLKVDIPPQHSSRIFKEETEEEESPKHKKSEKKGFFLFNLKEKITPQKEPETVNRLEITGGATEVLDEIFEPSIMLQGLGAAEEIELLVTKDVFKIGKKADAVDGVISFNNAISRIHCRIITKNGEYFIADAGSANGTYVNGGKLEPQHEVLIKPGDKVKLANSNFIVKKV